MLVVVLALAGCASSTTTTGAGATSGAASTGASRTPVPNGVASYVGQAINAEVFIQWTRSGDTLTGSLQEAIRKEAGSTEVESSSTAFTGTVAGDGLTLTLNQGLGSTKAVVGQLHGEGFTMTFPGQKHALTNITFVPGKVADYNHAVLELEGKAEQGGESRSTSPGEQSSPPPRGSLVGTDCESIRGPGGRLYAITAVAGFSCTTARHVFGELFAGNGERHEGADVASTYTTVDGWNCGSGTGAYACSPPGSREIRIEADLKGSGG